MASVAGTQGGGCMMSPFRLGAGGWARRRNPTTSLHLVSLFPLACSTLLTVSLVLHRPCCLVGWLRHQSCSKHTRVVKAASRAGPNLRMPVRTNIHTHETWRECGARMHSLGWLFTTSKAVARERIIFTDLQRIWHTKDSI